MPKTDELLQLEEPLIISKVGHLLKGSIALRDWFRLDQAPGKNRREKGTKALLARVKHMRLGCVLPKNG